MSPSPNNRHNRRAMAESRVSGPGDLARVLDKMGYETTYMDQARTGAYTMQSPSGDTEVEYYHDKRRDEMMYRVNTSTGSYEAGRKPQAVLDYLKLHGKVRGESTSRKNVHQGQREKGMGSDLQSRIAESLNETSYDASKGRGRHRVSEAMRGDVGQAFGAIENRLRQGIGGPFELAINKRGNDRIIVSTGLSPKGTHLLFRKGSQDIDVRIRHKNGHSIRLDVLTPDDVLDYPSDDMASRDLIKDIVLDYHMEIDASEGVGVKGRRAMNERGGPRLSDSEVVRAWKRGNSKGYGFNPEDEPGYPSRWEMVKTVGQGGETIKVYRVPGGGHVGVGDANGPWAIDLSRHYESVEELRRCLDEMTRAYLTSKALLDIPKEEQHDFLESLEPNDEFGSLSEFRSYINTRKSEFLGEDDDEGPGTEDWVHEVAQRIGDTAGWEGVERVDIAPAGLKRPEGVKGTIVRVCKPDYGDMPTEKEMESVRAKVRSEFPGVLSIWRGGHSVMFTARGVSESVVERSQQRSTLQSKRLEERMEDVADASRDVGSRIMYLAGFRS